MAATCSTIGDAMKAYRGMNGLAQRQLGELLGVKQTDISQIENGRKAAPPEVEAAFRALVDAEPPPGSGPPTTKQGAAILPPLWRAARQELGYPIGPEEASELAQAKPEELLEQSVLLREAMEAQASRELLAGAQAFRKKRETARNGGGRSC